MYIAFPSKPLFEQALEAMEEVMKVQGGFSFTDFHRQAVGSNPQEISLSIKILVNCLFYLLGGKVFPSLKTHLVQALADFGNSSSDYADMKYFSTNVLTTSRLTRYRTGEKVIKLLNMVEEAENPQLSQMRLEKKQRDTDCKVDRLERELKKLKTGTIFGQLTEPLAGRGSWGQHYTNCAADRKAILFGLQIKAIPQQAFTGDSCIPQQTLVRSIKVLGYMMADPALNTYTEEQLLMGYHQLCAKELGF